MLRKLGVLGTAAILLMAVAVSSAATIEVSQPTQISDDTHYERGCSAVKFSYDGYYYLFYGRSENVTGHYGNSSPDVHDYVIYYKKADSIAGLAGADAELVDNMPTTGDKIYQGQTSCVEYGSKLWVFAVDMGDGGGQVKAWTSADGDSWSVSDVLPFGTEPFEGNHLWATVYDGGIFLAVNRGGNIDITTYNGTLWSAFTQVVDHEGMPRLYVDGSKLYFYYCSWGLPSYYIYEYVAGPPVSWTLRAEITGTDDDDSDPMLTKLDGDYIFIFAPWNSGDSKQFLKHWTASAIVDFDGLTQTTTKLITAGGYGGTNWVDMWPATLTDGSDVYMFYGSEADGTGRGTGNIFMLEIDWDLSLDHYCYIQNAINEGSDGGGDAANVVNVADGTYTESVSIDEDVTITGESEAGVVVQANATAPVDGVNVFTVATGDYDVKIEKMTIRYGDYGIRSKSTGDVDVLHCTFYRNGWDGEPYDDPPNQTQCYNLWNSSHVTDGGSIRIEDSNGSEIAYCHIWGNCRGIRLQDGANGSIHDNTSHGNIEAGIYLAASTYNGDSGCTNTNVYDNESYENMNNGLLSIGGLGNSLYDNDVHDNWNSGVMLWHPSQIIVERNILDHNNLWSFNGAGNDGDDNGGIWAEGSTGTSGTFAFHILGNRISDSGVGGLTKKEGLRIGTSLLGTGIDVKYNVFTGHDIDVHIFSQAATTDINYNSFSGTDYGVLNDDAGDPTVDAENDWWGADDGPSGAGYTGAGCPVSAGVDADPWIGTASKNIVCVPDPLELNDAQPTKTVDIDYLGGASDLVYGVSVTFSWDDSKVTMNSISYGDLFPAPGGAEPESWFSYYGTGNSRTVDWTLLGEHPGTSEPGTLFTVQFTGTGCGDSNIDITSVLFRNKDNSTLVGVYERDGVIKTDVDVPGVSVTITNSTNPHFNDFAKNGDNLVLTATITDACGDLADITVTANLSTLLSGGSATATPDDYNTTTGVATWNLNSVLLTGDDLKTIEVTAKDLLLNSGTGSTTTTVDNLAPTKVTGFSAGPGHNKVDMLWDDPGATDMNFYEVVIRSNAWGTYPTYPGGVPDYPGDQTAGTAVWNGTGTSYTKTYLAAERDIYYYQAFACDKAMNYGPADADARDRATSYWLGDVALTNDAWGYDGLVTVNDINKLGGNYGAPPPGTGVGGYDECDVGPTDTGSRVGIPDPDNMIDFDDLMIFAMNYGVVSPRVLPLLPDPALESLALVLAEYGERTGEELELVLRLEGNSDEVKGMSASVAYDVNELEFVSARLSEEMSSPVADVFFWHGMGEGTIQVDLAVLGTGVTIGGSGDVAVLTFRMVGGEDVSVDLASALLRGAGNVELDAELGGYESTYGGDLPTVFRLVQNVPNPFNPVTRIAYHVPETSDVSIRIYNAAGQLVHTLVAGEVEPGRHSAVWNGRNDAGASVGSGVYMCTMDAGDYHGSQKMLLLK